MMIGIWNSISSQCCNRFYLNVTLSIPRLSCQNFQSWLDCMHLHWEWWSLFFPVREDRRGPTNAQLEDLFISFSPKKKRPRPRPRPQTVLLSCISSQFSRYYQVEWWKIWNIENATLSLNVLLWLDSEKMWYKKWKKNKMEVVRIQHFFLFCFIKYGWKAGKSKLY